MAKLLLAIGGRVEEGEALSASVFNTATGTSALTGFTLQWQVFNGSIWTNVGPANSLTYTIPTGTSAVGKSYRLVSTPTGANEASTSATTAPVVADTNKIHAPTLVDVAASLTVAENAAATLLDGTVTFSDADNGNFGGGSLTVLNSNSLAAGGDGLDLLSVRNQAAGAGQITYNAATREVFYGGPSGSPVLIGVVDVTLGGNGADLKIAFNANATKAAIDKLIENIQFSNNDDSPTGARLLTIKVVDPDAGSVQRVMQVNVTPAADGPSFTGPSAFTANENQTAAGTVTAIDPDREAGAAQGISYSLVAGTGSTDNALFTLDAATGQLGFVSAPDFEGAHGAAYSVRVRASDSNGGVVERVVTVQVQGVNEAPVAQALSATVQEDAAATTLAASFSDPDAGDSHTITLNTAGTAGTVTRQGSNFSYDAGSQFQSLVQGRTATDTFTYTVTDAGGLSSTRTATITIVGSNDAAVVGGTTTSDVHEDENVVNGLLMASGVLSVTDADAGQAHFVAQASVAGDLFGGIFSVDANGAWTWQLANNSPVGQVVPGGASYADSFTVTTADGTTQVVSVNVHGANDVAVIAGTTSVSVQEDVGVVGGLIKATGVATIADPDFYEARLVSQLGVAGSGGLGSFNVFEQGTWNYRVDNSLAQVQALGEGQTLVDTLQVSSIDGSASKTLTATIVGSNDGPAITTANGANLGEVTEAGFVTGGIAQATGTLQASDPDAGDTLTWSGNATGTFGHLEIAAATGLWTYVLHDDAPATQALASGQIAVDTFIASVSDSHGGTAQQLVTVTVHGANDAPVIASGSELAGLVQAPTVGTGMLTLDLAAQYGNDSTAVDNAGRIVVIGQGQDQNGFSTQVIARLNADGTPDETFGDGGQIAATPYFKPASVAVDAAGRYLVAGYTFENYTHSQLDWAVERRHPDGSLDTSFGNGGKVTFDFGGYDSAQSVHVDSAGILVSGYVPNAQTGFSEQVILRLDSNGAPVVGFGDFGRLACDINGGSMTVDALGHIVVWGFSEDAQTGQPQFHIARYLPDGSADTSFGDAGVVAINPGAARPVGQLAVGADGQILLGGIEFTGDWNYTPVSLALLRPDGSLETGFGNEGWAHTGLSAETLQLSFDAQGRPLVGFSSPVSADFHLARFTLDGALDPSFHLGGTTHADLGGEETVEDIHVLSTGDVLVVGTNWQGSNLETAFASFDNEGNLNTAFGEAPPAGALVASGVLYVVGNGWDNGDTAQWTGGATGLYGEFQLTPQGSWTYVLDVNDPDTQALEDGTTGTEHFIATVKDSFGASASCEVVVTVVGSYDPPAP